MKIRNFVHYKNSKTTHNLNETNFIDNNFLKCYTWNAMYFSIPKKALKQHKRILTHPTTL